MILPQCCICGKNKGGFSRGFSLREVLGDFLLLGLGGKTHVPNSYCSTFSRLVVRRSKTRAACVRRGQGEAALDQVRHRVWRHLREEGQRLHRGRPEGEGWGTRFSVWERDTHASLQLLVIIVLVRANSGNFFEDNVKDRRREFPGFSCSVWIQNEGFQRSSR